MGGQEEVALYSQKSSDHSLVWEWGGGLPVLCNNGVFLGEKRRVNGLSLFVLSKARNRRW